MTETSWDAVLDAFEARLESQRTALAQGSVEPVPAWDPPTPATGLPPEMTSRAQQLLQRCHAIEADLAGALQAAGELLARPEPASAPAPAPVYFDSRV